MTPFEIDLLRTVWPYLWTLIIGSGTWFLRAQNRRLESIATTLAEFGAELRRVEKQMLEEKANLQHRLDRVIGDADARFSGIEATCEAQHGQLFRRASDSRPVNWAHDSDVRGSPK
ncbi:MAG: hypothetical protein JNJ76_13830 [Candidatus Competibacter sp.]|nr:hypothetical protein [Candidatus Competibacter sp.]